MPHRLAIHETIEIHEILTFKNTCMTKSQTMQALVTDEGLKSLMLRDVEQSTRAISELQELLNRGKTQ